MPDLDALLLDLADHLDVPAADDLTDAVVARIRADGTVPRDRSLGSGRRRLLLVAAAVVVVVGIVAGTVPSARQAVADLLGFERDRITRVPDLSDDVVGRPTVDVTGLQLGDPTSLEGAREEVPFAVRVPDDDAGIGAPDGVYLSDVLQPGQVSMVWEADDRLPEAEETGLGLLLVQVAGRAEPGMFGKLVARDSTIELVDVGGATGYWIAGAPHVVFYVDPSGEPQAATTRLAGNVLLWERDGVLLRLESALDRESVLRIARAVR